MNSRSVVNFLVVLFCSATVMETCFAAGSPPTIGMPGPVVVDGRRLLVDFDRDGIYQPYMIKGVGYSPYPVGRYPGDGGSNIFDDPNILSRDFSYLRTMYANTIRIWSQGMTQRTLDLANQYGLKIIAGFWIHTNEPYCQDGQRQYPNPDFTNQSIRNQYIQQFVDYVNTFKDHSAILFWAIGDGVNRNLDPNDPIQIQAFYSLVDEMAQAAHYAEGSSYHPVALVNNDLTYIGDVSYGSADSQLSHVDIWAVNTFRGASFGSLFTDFADRSTKPLWVSLYGIDAWHSLDATNPADGYEDQAAQASWAGNLWDEIIRSNNITIGGTIMEYSDEWWKPFNWIIPIADSSVHNYYGFGPQDTDCDGNIDWYPPSPDNFFNEEWWGVMSVASNPDCTSPDILIPRMVYYTLKDKFKPQTRRGGKQQHTPVP